MTNDRLTPAGFAQLLDALDGAVEPSSIIDSLEPDDRAAVELSARLMTIGMRMREAARRARANVAINGAGPAVVIRDNSPSVSVELRTGRDTRPSRRRNGVNSLLVLVALTIALALSVTAKRQPDPRPTSGPPAGSTQVMGPIERIDGTEGIFPGDATETTVSTSTVEYDQVEISGAVESEAEAIAIALRETTDERNPREPIARLLPATELGKWHSQCQSWEGDYPVWLVAIRTDPPTPYAYPGSEPRSQSAPRDNEGFYVYILANPGEIRSWGDIGNWEAYRTAAAALRNHDLPIAYSSPMPPIRGNTSPVLGSTEALATVRALPTAEFACRERNWGGTTTPYPNRWVDSPATTTPAP